LPVIFPTQVASNKTHESVLRFEKERLNHDWGIHLHGQTSEKTIKKYREDESIPWGLRHLVPSLKKDPRILYKHTPIGELLEAAPYQGSHALHYLNDYAELKHDLKFMKVFGEPTHDNLIGLIALREQENNKLNEDKGKNYRDLLITHKILNGFERITATVQLLYVNPACYQQEKLLPVRIDPGALGWHSTDTFWDLRISLIHRVSEHERAEMADIAEVIDYITQKKAHGTKKLMFSEIDDACRFSKGKSRALILNHPGKIKFYKIMPTVIVLQK
jgi:hypothetical protein